MSLHPNALPVEMEAEAMRLDTMATDPAATPEQVMNLQQGAANLRQMAWRARSAARRRAMLRLLASKRKTAEVTHPVHERNTAVREQVGGQEAGE